MTTTTEQLPRIVKKSSCVTVCAGNEVLGSFAGPARETNAEIFCAAIAADRASRAAGGEVFAWRYSRNGGKTWHVTDAGDPTDIMPDTGGIVIPLVAASPSAPDAIQAAWSDCKVAFDCDEEALWVAWDAGKLQLPAGWSLNETDASGARCVAIFRVEVLPTYADGKVVQEVIAAFQPGTARS